jgi:hypothetical protein
MNDHKRLTPAQIYVRVATLIALPLALVALIPSLYAVYRVWQVADDAQSIAQENRHATCTFVADLQERYDATDSYLKAVNEHRIAPISGIDLKAAALAQSNRLATIESFQDLDCKGEEGK